MEPQECLKPQTRRWGTSMCSNHPPHASWTTGVPELPLVNLAGNCVINSAPDARERIWKVFEKHWYTRRILDAHHHVLLRVPHSCVCIKQSLVLSVSADSGASKRFRWRLQLLCRCIFWSEAFFASSFDFSTAAAAVVAVLHAASWGGFIYVYINWTGYRQHLTKKKASLIFIAAWKRYCA